MYSQLWLRSCAILVFIYGVNRRVKMKKKEFGDFQTPIALARKVIKLIHPSKDLRVLEPTCGVGTFLQACIEYGIPPEYLSGWEVNPQYVQEANEKLPKPQSSIGGIVKVANFFQKSEADLRTIAEYGCLFLGNPPWVTNAELGKLLSTNIPNKSNFQAHKGFDAISGKSNFDISEWILIELIKAISGTESQLAMLVKTSVARKVYLYAINHSLKIKNFKIIPIDALKDFNVNVDACLFFASGGKDNLSKECEIYRGIDEPILDRVIGTIDGQLVSNLVTYSKLKHILTGCEFKWRSGLKHDASKVMELRVVDGILVNGYGEKLNIDNDYTFPLYKSSHIAKESLPQIDRYVIVTQRKVGDETDSIRVNSPEVWDYLNSYTSTLDSRRSSIYKNKPRFSIFGVGEYTFKPWKVVISGLYKNIKFSVVGSFKDKPILVDDTCYTLSFDSKEKATFVNDLLNSSVCQNLLRSLIFADNKRPITASILNRVNIKELSKQLNKYDEYCSIFSIEDALQ